mgnify:CR=1 FL=1
MVAKHNLLEANKWAFSGLAALLFIILAAPVSLKLTGSVLSKIGISKPIFVVIFQAIIFALIIRLMMLIPLPNTDENYTGLANPASMLSCNTAQLLADVEGCKDCVDAATVCMDKPFENENCKKAINKCQKTCDNLDVRRIMDNCYIQGFHDYFPQGGGC